MDVVSFTRASGVVLALFLATVATRAAAAPPDALGHRRPATIDAELTEAGAWQGVVATVQGQGVPKTRLALVPQMSAQPENGQTLYAVTDRQGRFCFSNVPLGAYWLRAGDSVHRCRFWRAGTGPRGADGPTLLVQEQVVYRGNLYDRISARPALMYTGIAAAVLTPVIVVGSDNATDNIPASP